MARTAGKMTGKQDEALWPGQPGYPKGLLRLGYPVKVFCRGHWAIEPEQAVAVVGTRSPTRRGVAVTEALVARLAQHKLAVVSGMAKGIDAAAHRAALGYGLPTAAVLGCGIDIAYPSAHQVLMQQIAAHGAVFSEHPPGTQPLRGHFPKRNRLIAALSRAVFVMEAGLGSGALHTAVFAKRLGVPVLVPKALAAGPEGEGLQQLLQQGALGFDTFDEAMRLIEDKVLAAAA
jgi:DNA processing protein